MLRDAVREFGQDRVRRRALDADAACAAPPELLHQANELGLTMVGVPEELGGAVEERSAMTTVLMSEALAQGDMGIAVACLAPAAVSTAISLWGDAQQQSTYLPEFVGDDVPAAALAMLEPRRCSIRLRCEHRARRRRRLRAHGVKALVPRARRRASCSWSPPSWSRPARAVHRRVQGRRHQRRARPRHGHPRRRHRPPASSRTSSCRPRRCSAAASPTPTPSASRWPGWPGARWPSAPARRCSTT